MNSKKHAVTVLTWTTATKQKYVTVIATNATSQIAKTIRITRRTKMDLQKIN